MWSSTATQITHPLILLKGFRPAFSVIINEHRSTIFRASINQA
jgi:hypothetical protein